MARPLRLEFAGALYRVTARGNERRRIFLGGADGDRAAFLGVLGQTRERFNWICHAYCLMTNHYDCRWRRRMPISPRACASSTACTRSTSTAPTRREKGPGSNSALLRELLAHAVRANMDVLARLSSSRCVKDEDDLHAVVVATCKHPGGLNFFANKAAFQDLDLRLSGLA
jgi:hypothetical protein